ncbi:M1 family metallopeptidase [Reichenbachiella versicolor]|uniref:M1 family metallopeptidase n=1 Tax=Reichenbachiella versicolor TaxID=1821036 RepID=UPI001C87D8F0|nr:M1 family metallopeptidase [Reichenbachiella versicolor]
MIRRLIILIAVLAPLSVFSQGEWNQKFEQLGTDLPTPNTYRTASGAPGKDYWQQRADYKIAVTLKDETQSIEGEETITYYNYSPDDLKYLWVQLDQNIRDQNSEAVQIDSDGLNRVSQMKKELSGKQLQALGRDFDFDGGFKITSVTDSEGKDLPNLINGTMMRIDLPEPLVPQGEVSFNIKWKYNVQDRMNMRGRSGYEYFPEDENYLYTIAQFYPRMAVYDNVEGWQNKQFLGNGEFTLEFGDFEVDLTVPADFVVAATGSLQNETDVLTMKQMDRMKKARKSFEKPFFIITEEEAKANESSRSKESKTWKFKAENVRDFAFAASRKFIWDAQAVKIGDKTPMAMSFYPKEGNPLWELESTKAVVNTLKTYSKYTIDYPYPVAISVHSASIGMEYPMICFNWGRPDADGKYTDAKKWRTIMVIIHEVGHNFFPMIINSDERQWTWMDEGLNSFVESVTERECYPDMPVRRGPAKTIVKYMKSDKEMMRPIMTNSEQIIQFGNNAYGKPAAGLDILRQTVMGPELFDYAFKEYATRWAFKHPTPADFFRTMEDASAIDLDWFWKGWFYTTDNVDISVDKVTWFQMGIPEPEELENKAKRSRKIKKSGGETESMTTQINDEPKTFSVKDTDKKYYGEFMNVIDDKKIMMNHENKQFYEVKFSNQGGLVMPVIIKWTYEDGTEETEKLPAEVWRMNEQEFTKVFIKDKKVVGVQIDPLEETADVNPENNFFPRSLYESEFDEVKKEG